MRTEYTPANGEFTDAAHAAARRLVYPRVFGVGAERLSFEDTQVGGTPRGQMFDAEYGVDRIVRVETPNLRAPLTYTVQERFRRMRHLSAYGDRITVTEWNRPSQLPSELYKIIADLMLFAFFDPGDKDRPVAAFHNVSVVNVARLKWIITRSNITWTMGVNPKQQDYIELRVVDLAERNILLYHEDYIGAAP